MRTRFKPWAAPYLEDHPELVIKEYDSNDDFYRCDKLYLEIGTGKGEFILGMAKLSPNAHFIGIELSPTIAAIASRKLVNEEINNVKMCQNDATIFISAFPNESFDKIFLNFSDPWPKKRHEKRRLTYPKNLLQYYRILKCGGELLFKTDNEGLYEYSMEKFALSPFTIISNNLDYDGNDPSDTMTEYENEFRQVGTKIKRVILRKEKIDV